MRYWIVATVCRLVERLDKHRMCQLFGHPDKRTKQAGGKARIACPCGFVDIGERRFDTERDEENPPQA